MRPMTEKQIEFTNLLFDFVKRASQKEATEAEVAALPAVAEALRGVLFLNLDY